MNLVILFLSLQTVFAARTVKIALGAKQTELVLSNPSSMAVNYDITCYSQDGSQQIINLTSQSVAPNAKDKHTVEIADSGKCSGGVSPYSSFTDANGAAYYFCNNTTATYANANNVCGTGNTFCFPKLNCGHYGDCTANTFWLKNDGTVQFKAACSSFTSVTSGFQVVIKGNVFSNQAKNSQSTSCAFYYRVEEKAVGETHGAVCCADPVPGSLCKVTINSTDPNAYLSSPSFKGGSAF